MEARREPVAVLVRRHRAAITVLGLVLLAASVAAGWDEPWFMAALVPLAPIAAACAVIDAKTRLIPTPLVQAAGAAGLGLLLVAAIVTGAWSSLGRAALAGATAGAVFFAMYWITRGSVGMGDVRLIAVLGLYAGWLGWAQLLAVVVAAYFIALPVAVARLARGRRDAIAFGPFLIAGFYVALIGSSLLS
jgi:leader peptidase (prepilin peptidase)/N-methyltransferase